MLNKTDFNERQRQLGSSADFYGGVDAIVVVYGDRMFRVVEAVAATAIGFGSEAWVRILAGAKRLVVARLLVCALCLGGLARGLRGRLGSFEGF
jgi:hypothetical protein